MDENQSSQRTRRLAFVISGVMDTIVGAVIVMIGLGARAEPGRNVLPVDAGQYGLPTGLVIAIGGVMLVSGMAIAIYHVSRLGE